MSSAKNLLISLSSAAEIARKIYHNDLLDHHDTAFVVYDFRRLHEKTNLVKEAFPIFWNHAVAIKSNPLHKVIEHIGTQGLGLEAASYEEVWLAQQSNAHFIIWDSPAKTEDEISKVIQSKTPVIINANSLEELKFLTRQNCSENTRIGLRINPLMKLSSLSSMTVGAENSKFGEPISNSNSIKELIADCGMKIGLHVHASSQNLQLDESVLAIKKIYDLALEIGFDKISYIDIGGGFPAFYGFEETAALSDYANLLHEKCPRLFDESIDVYTEFGRFYHANAGFHISKINEVKSFSDQQTLTIHLGADMFLRESYQPGVWKHRLALINHDFELIACEKTQTDIGGPLCFGGDYIAKNIALSRASSHDYLMIMDTGANSFALWSMHCSRTFPKVIGIDDLGNPFILKHRQTLEDIARFWS